MNFDYAEFARHGSSTVYEASGKEGLVAYHPHQLVPGSRVCGPARIVRCAQDDNLMVHAVMAQAQPGEVLVLTMPEPRPVALVGEILAIQAQVRGVSALLIDAAARDVEEIARLGLPVWARFISPRGAVKMTPGSIGDPALVGGVRIENGDAVVLDADGAVVVRRSRLEEVLALTRERTAKEDDLRRRLAKGAITYDLHGLRRLVEGDGNA